MKVVFVNGTEKVGRKFTERDCSFDSLVRWICDEDWNAEGVRSKPMGRARGTTGSYPEVPRPRVPHCW